MNNLPCHYIFMLSCHILSILQYMNVKYKDSFPNDLIKTKCLNTAVMLIMLLIGEKKLKDIQFCNVNPTVSRHLNKLNNNAYILNSLISSLTRKTKHSYMYYIMLTDGALPRLNEENLYFPGHVFIVEKTNNEYNIYQSYIKEYDLNDHMNKTKCKKIKISEIHEMCNFFKRFITTDYSWNSETVKYWNKLTGIDTKGYMGYKTENIYLCFKKFKANNFKNKINNFIDVALDEIKTNISNKKLEAYSYVKSSTLSSYPQTIFELEKDLIKLKNKIKVKK